MKSKKWLGYTIYGILVTFLFLYVLFPSHRMADYIESVVSERNPGVDLSIESADIAFPLGLSCEKVVLGFKGEPGSKIEADLIKGRFSLISLLKGDFSLLLKAEAYGGNVDTRLDSPDRFSSGNITADMTIEGIDLGKCAYLKDVTGRDLGGLLGGALLYEGSWPDIINGEGNASFSLTNGTIGLQKDMFGFETLVFEKAEGKMILKNRIVALDSLKVGGKEMTSSLSGRIFINRNFAQSRLSLKGNIDIEALGKNLSLNVRGTISKPLSNVR
ncbi:MAG: type II secretion system protein GspN [Thermodesulfobacteriota bacterium]|nr:type II secretion system protein GspN [Thermodesulfobacteriota bacterium]